MFKTSAEAITTAAHQCNVRQFQGEPYLLPLTALIIAVKAELGRGKAQSTEPCKPAGTKRGVQGREGCVMARGSQQTAAALHTTGLCGGDTLGTGPYPSVTLPCQHSFTPGPSRFPALPKETHLLCGLQPPGRCLCRSHCCHCWSCWLGLLSQRPWRGSLQQSWLLSLVPLCLQAGGEPSLVPGLMLESWRGPDSL